MTRKCFFAGLVLLASILTSRAEVIRTFLTKENRFPGKHHLEAGADFNWVERNDFESTPENEQGDLSELAPYLRFGLAENFAVHGAVPFVWNDPEFGDNEEGLGDVTLGFELRVWEDIFHYPWIMPHGEVSLDTGDEDKGTGAGQTLGSIGLAVGSVAWEVVSFILDARYQNSDDSEDDVASLAGAIVWDLGSGCALMGEVEVDNDDVRSDNDHSVLIVGGLSYQPTEDWMLILRGGGGKDTRENAIASARLAYTF